MNCGPLPCQCFPEQVGCSRSRWNRWFPGLPMLVVVAGDGLFRLRRGPQVARARFKITVGILKVRATQPRRSCDCPQRPKPIRPWKPSDVPSRVVAFHRSGNRPGRMRIGRSFLRTERKVAFCDPLEVPTSNVTGLCVVARWSATRAIWRSRTSREPASRRTETPLAYVGRVTSAQKWNGVGRPIHSQHPCMGLAEHFCPAGMQFSNSSSRGHDAGRIMTGLMLRPSAASCAATLI